MVTMEFYTKEEYAKLLQVADDKDTLEPDYDKWFAGFTDLKKKMERAMPVIAVPINVERLVVWCKQNKLKNIDEERVLFAHELKKMVF